MLERYRNMQRVNWRTGGNFTVIVASPRLLITIQFIRVISVAVSNITFTRKIHKLATVLAPVLPGIILPTEVLGISDWIVY